MSRVAVVTDSASDMDPGRADSLGITIIPLIVNFGRDAFSAGVDLSTADFWKRMTAPDAPFPTTAACSPGDFQVAYQRLFDAGADGIVSVHVAGTLSGTIKAAEVARASLRDRDIQIVDSMSASMGEGMLAELAVQMSNEGKSATEIAEALNRRREDLQVYLALETLEYLKKGGRISGTQAAIGTLLSVKPIIAVANGEVETVDKVRTRSKARERLIELITERPVERLAILHTVSPDVEAFRDEILARMPGLDASGVTIGLVGASVGPHVGPGCVGAAILYRA